MTGMTGEYSEKEKSKKQPSKVKEQTEGYQVEPRYEIIAGMRYEFLSSPKVNHQLLSAGIQQMLYVGCELEGIVLSAPLDVHLDKENVIQPDIIFICNDNLSIIKDQKIQGAPDLLVEILSPSTGGRDKVMKKELYERFGVREYWVVDPVHFTVDQFMLHNGSYVLHGVYDRNGIVRSPNFPCMLVDISRLYRKMERFMPIDE